MDMENQRRVKELAERESLSDLVVLLGGAEPDSVGLTAETVTTGDPTFSGPLAGVSLGLPVYHILEPELRDQIDAQVFDDQVGMMEMVLDVPRLVEEMRRARRTGP